MSRRLEHARRAVCSPHLRDTVTEKELSDILSELPRGYREALL